MIVNQSVSTWPRLAVAVAWDVGGWAVGVLAAAWLRVDYDLAAVDPVGVVLLVAVAVLLQVVLGLLTGLYRGRYATGSAESAVLVAVTFAATGVLTLLVRLAVMGQEVPRSVAVIATPIALVLALVGRLSYRALRARAARRPDSSEPRRVVVFGAGPAGEQLIRSMREAGGHRPVAVLDDDPRLRHRRVAGIGVAGGAADLLRVAAAEEVDLLAIAQPEVDGEVMRRLAGEAAALGLGIKVVPPLSELLRPWAGVSDLRDIDITDLLGRRPVEIDLAAVESYVGGRRVLVTGAGGSIGSELCRQLHRFGPAALYMLDRDESALHATQLSIYGAALLDGSDVILADIRDAAALHAVFADTAPDIVFHAAALKHLPLLERYPEEGWKTNVVGTQHVIDAAEAAGVECFVNISTDKAANPVSVLGSSKRIGERLIAYAARENPGRYLSVRFGNVLASRGSVLTTFAEQLAAGHPITVTHPDVTRYFMTIPEAVQLVIYAAVIGGPGETLVLDMGEPVRIADVARQMSTMAGCSPDIVYTGLRAGEKLHEELFGAGEEDRRPVHPAVSHVDVPPLDPSAALRCRDAVGSADALVELTRGGRSVPTIVRQGRSEGQGGVTWQRA